jgi:methionyl-tRNA formyltransferase
VSIMQLDEGMDTGPVYLERRVAIDPAETAGELLARLAPIGAAALVETLAMIDAGTARAIPQDHAAVTYAPMLTKADGAIDFSGDAAAIAARIRGVDPWPGAYAVLRGQLLKLFHARPHDGGGLPPGTVIAIDAAGVHVACGTGAVAIREVQAAGRKRLTGAQFAAGRGIVVGDVLGVGLP